jgi:hypothetical protein
MRAESVAGDDHASNIMFSNKFQVVHRINKKTRTSPDRATLTASSVFIALTHQLWVVSERIALCRDHVGCLIVALLDRKSAATDSSNDLRLTSFQMISQPIHLSINVL